MKDYRVIFILLFFLLNTNLIFAEFVSSNGLNVRTTPSSESTVLGQLKKGEEVSIIEIKDGWGKIIYSGKEGWISINYLSKEKPKMSDVKKQESNIVTIIFIILFSFFIFSILKKIIYSRCPSCKNFFALKYVGTNILDRYITPVKVSVKQRAKNGQVYGSQDQYIQVTKEKYQKVFKCKYCNNTLSRIGARTLE